MNQKTLQQFCRCVIPTAVVVVAVVVSSPATLRGDWPQFRGPQSDNKVTGFTAPATWPKELKKGWSVSVGDGLASPAMVGGKIYTFTRKGGDEVIACYEAETGKQLWSDKYAT